MIALAIRPHEKGVAELGKHSTPTIYICGGASKETLDIFQKPAQEIYTLKFEYSLIYEEKESVMS